MTTLTVFKRSILTFLCVFVFAFLSPVLNAQTCLAIDMTLTSDDSGSPTGTWRTYSTTGLYSRYLRQARAYRSDGRYELARQSYAQALSLCPNTKKLRDLQEELAGVDLLLRTMR